MSLDTKRSKMPQYLPPPNLPTPTPVIVPQQKSDRLLNRNRSAQQRQHYSSLQARETTTAPAQTAQALPLFNQFSSVLPRPSATEADPTFDFNSATFSFVQREFVNDVNLFPLAISSATASNWTNSARTLGTPLSVGRTSTKIKLRCLPRQECRSEANPEVPSILVSPSAIRRQQKPISATITRLITQERGGNTQEFEFSTPATEENLAPEIFPSPTQRLPTVEETVSVVEVMADRQEYDQQQEVITAQGNVELRFSRAVLSADRLQVNLPNRLAVAQGNVVLRRGDQTLRGERFEYSFFQDQGVIQNASGEVYLPTVNRDSASGLPTDPGRNLIPEQPLGDRLLANQPLQRLTTTEGYRFTVGSIRDLSLLSEGEFSLPSIESGGQINRLRFQAERIEFEADTWQATNIRVTNDPFSPPELEIQADTATFRNISPQVDEVVTTNSRVVFDQGFSLPLFQNRLVFDRRPRQPAIAQFGFDGEERGGLFIERNFNLIDTERVRFAVVPQYFIQRALFPGILDEEGEGGVVGSSVFGVKTELNVNFSPRTTLEGIGSLTSLELDELADELRVSLQLQQRLGNLERPHLLSLQYNYRERLFNGSLGFQRVQSSIGAVIASPVVAIGNTGVDLSYQASIQNIDAETDRDSLLDEDEDEDIVNLTRFQAAASLSKDFLLWQGEALPPTPDAGMRYSPAPVQPFLQLTTGITGVASFYSNGDTQPSVRFSVGVEGQLGHFSRSTLDYTGFNIRYSQGIRGDSSPFQFDRFVDQSTVSFGITQQVYGPFRAGFQTSLSLDEGEDISTDYFLEYSRRTYNILLRYNPVLEIGSINFRINDFNWVGDPEPFNEIEVQPVVQGVTR